MNETDINIVFEILNYRYLNYLPIIVSTEYTVERLLNFDEAIGSRIYEMCKDYIVETFVLMADNIELHYENKRLRAKVKRLEAFIRGMGKGA